MNAVDDHHVTSQEDNVENISMENNIKISCESEVRPEFHGRPCDTSTNFIFDNSSSSDTIPSLHNGIQNGPLGSGGGGEDDLDSTKDGPTNDSECKEPNETISDQISECVPENNDTHSLDWEDSSDTSVAVTAERIRQNNRIPYESDDTSLSDDSDDTSGTTENKLEINDTIVDDETREDAASSANDEDTRGNEQPMVNDDETRGNEEHMVNEEESFVNDEEAFVDEHPSGEFFQQCGPNNDRSMEANEGDVSTREFEDEKHYEEDSKDTYEKEAVSMEVDDNARNEDDVSSRECETEKNYEDESKDTYEKESISMEVDDNVRNDDNAVSSREYEQEKNYDEVSKEASEKDAPIDNDSFSTTRDTTDDSFSVNDSEVTKIEDGTKVDDDDFGGDNKSQDVVNESCEINVKPHENGLETESYENKEFNLPMETSDPVDDKDSDDDLPEDALTIDTGKWSPDENDEKQKNIYDFGEQSASHQPSDDDVDPDALMIDTAPIDDEKLSEVDENPDEQPVLHTNPPEHELKMTISLKSKFKKGAIKRIRKNVTRQGKTSAKAVKKRVQIPGDTLKCPRCPLTSFTTVMALIEHQEKCRAFSTAPVVQQAEIPKVPRKVYMCSACGSYLENWNLFVHMKEMHKRNICLHCLGMFSQASKLIQHLALKHGVVDQVLDYGDQLRQIFPGPQFLLCSRCDQMCTDKTFEAHSCSSICSHCGLSGTHYPTCRLAPPPTLKPPKMPKRRARMTKKPRRQAAPIIAPPSISTMPQEDVIIPPEAPSPADDISPTTYNEKMLQLYRIKQPERSFSTLESIEESINRVIEEAKSPEKEYSNFNDESHESETIDDVKEDELDVEEEVQPSPPPAPQVAPEVPMKSESESSDSEKLTINLEPKRRQRVNNVDKYEQRRFEMVEKTEAVEESDGVVLAGEDVPFTCVPLPEPLDTARVPIAMKLFLRATALTCVYCAHARKIAVNAKQLALHQLAQHRYITVAESTPQVDKVANHAIGVRAMREALQSLESVYFNAYGFDSSDRSAWRSADRVYECFHCSFITPDLREFSMHNRKIHCNDLRKSRQSESHLCIMCKTRFLTYSELLCHLCCGVYVPGRIIDPNCRYRCYCCDIEPLPSSFRLMVHLRQTHTACDMCFALCDSQSALSAHVLKHKSLFYCYACGLTYETRIELSKHIFWKHGAESVTCKRCLQKKWRHAYHFCLPPPSFTCDTCGSLFKTAAMLRVHSRLHSEIFPHSCTECFEKFISKKLLLKHAITHAQPSVPAAVNGDSSVVEPEKESPEKSKKDIRDLFDLPPVNLSESDDSSGDEQTAKKERVELPRNEPAAALPPVLGTDDAEVPSSAGTSTETAPAPATVWDGVLASLEEKCKGISYAPDSPFFNLPLHRVLAIALAEHDYCGTQSVVKDDSQVGREHDYCNNGNISKTSISKHSPRKMSKRRTRSSSSESSSSSSSSCSCGSNCSCSSSTSSTESASSGEPRPQRKNKAQLKAEKRKKVVEPKVEPEPEPSVEVCDVRIQESDLETDEPVTDDEEFYEQNPALRASEVLRLNRSMLLDKLENVPSKSVPYTPSPVPKVKSRKKRVSRGGLSLKNPRAYSSPFPPVIHADDSSNTSEGDGKRPRRKRVPLKFYGFSSGEEDEMSSSQPSRKRERLVEVNTTTAASPPQASALPAPYQPPPPAEQPASNLWNPPSWRAPPVPPRVNPIKIRTGSLKQTFAKSNNSDEFHIKRAELGGFHVNGGGGGGNTVTGGTASEKLYCFCQCPYDEVSEMIACDAMDCVIEWFHFECVGIMDPPKGKWYCPDCRKKAAAKNEMMGIIR